MDFQHIAGFFQPVTERGSKIPHDVKMMPLAFYVVFAQMFFQGMMPVNHWLEMLFVTFGVEVFFAVDAFVLKVDEGQGLYLKVFIRNELFN